MGNGPGSVSVVIPSTGRPELSRAIESVRQQDFSGSVEIVVAFDLDAATTAPSVLARADSANIVVFTGGSRKGGAARNLGVQAASGEWIAFLDDDDEWDAEKLTLQVAAASLLRNSGRHPLIGCRVKQIVATDSKLHIITGVPNRLIGPNEPVEEYLFLNRRPGAKRSSFFTSTVLAHRELCIAVQWDEHLARHQDWDWLIRAQIHPSVEFVQLSQELVSIHVGTNGSISAGASWKGSLSWAKKVLQPRGNKVFVDFLMAQTLRYALHKREWEGVRLVIEAVRHAKTLPSPGPLVIGAAGLLPRTTLQNLMRRIR